MSKTIKIFFICLFCFSSVLIAFERSDIQKRILDIESLIHNNLSAWKIKRGDTTIAEITAPVLSEWDTFKPGDSSQEKVFWILHEFQAPKTFSGVKTQGSSLHLSCLFRGLGVFEGQFFLDGGLKESFTLEFGNQTQELEREFLLRSKTVPAEKLNVAFRFKNRGRLPLLEKEEAEPGTYIQIREARFSLSKATEAHRILSQFLLDVKAGAILLDLLPQQDLPPHRMRPVDEAYQKHSASKPFLGLKQTFTEALMNFDLSSLQNGDFSSIKKSLFLFYQKIKPVSRFSQKYTITVGGNSHIDLAWLWRWMESVEVAKETFSTILDNIEEFPEIVYIQSQAQAYEWMEKYHPDVFERIRKNVTRGRWEIIGGMWAEPDCNLIDGESFIRQILYGKRYFKEKFGVDVRIGWNPDSFGYNWNMPQFFKKSGIHSFVTQKISWNDTTIFPHFLFWWEGPDGSRVLSYFPPTGYVGTLDAENMIKGVKQFEVNTGLKDAFILYGIGNHGGGPNREMLNRARTYGEMNLFPKIRHSSFSDYLDQLKKDVPKTLPVWKDELYLEYHRGTYTTQAETKKLNRKSEVLLSDAEKLSSLAYLFGRPYSHENFNNAWKRVLMNQFHDILPGSSINPVYKDARESYKAAHKLARNELASSLEFLAQRISTDAGAEGIPVLIFNPLSWERNGLATVKLPQDLEGDVKVIDDSSREIPSQILSSSGENILCFTARKVPSLGYRVYKIQKGKAASSTDSVKISDSVLENRYFRITLHPETGNIISIFDKSEKREVLASSSQANQLQLFEDIPSQWDAWNIGYTGRSWMLDKAESIDTAHRGPVMASLEVKKNFLGYSKARREPTSDFPSSFFTQEIILYDSIPRIDIRMEADWWEDHVLMKVAFPVDIRSKKATYEIPFASVQRPTSRNTEWEKARFEVPAIRWADLSDSAYGVSLINESKYGYDIKDNVMRLTLLRAPLWPDPMADRGKHRISYSLYPHRGGWREADTVLRGYEFNSPLLTLLLDSHAGDLPQSFSFLAPSPSNIVLATVKKTEDRESLIIRLYESEGQETDALIEVPGNPKKIYDLDLMENRLQAVSKKGNVIALHFGKYEVKTLELIY